MLKTEEALAVMLSAQDYDAELAERYGWIDRALPAGVLANCWLRRRLRRARIITGGGDCCRRAAQKYNCIFDSQCCSLVAHNVADLQETSGETHKTTSSAFCHRSSRELQV